MLDFGKKTYKILTLKIWINDRKKRVKGDWREKKYRIKMRGKKGTGKSRRGKEK